MARHYSHGVLLAIVLVCGALAGCSGSAPATSTTEPASTTLASGAQSPTATPTTTSAATTPATVTPTQTETATATEPPTDTATATSAPPAAPIDGGTARRATVIEVTDGDTVDVKFENGETDTIRLIGVDTPETSASNLDPSEYGVPDTAHGREWLLHWGEQAAQFATDKLAGEQILVVTDPESDTRGYYGRLLAYIYIDGSNFGKQLLDRGYARVYTGGEFVLEEEYLALEADAQAADKGLWAFEDDQPSPSPPPTETESSVELPPPSNDGDLPDPYDCSDFDGSPDTVLRTYMQHHPDDPSELDADGDGVACGVAY